jgi:hypothetical protein
MSLPGAGKHPPEVIHPGWYTEALGQELLREPPGWGQALLCLSHDGPGLFLKQVADPPSLHFDHEGNRTALFELRIDDLECAAHITGRLELEVTDDRSLPERVGAGVFRGDRGV